MLVPDRGGRPTAAEEHCTVLNRDQCGSVKQRPDEDIIPEGIDGPFPSVTPDLSEISDEDLVLLGSGVSLSLLQ